MNINTMEFEIKANNIIEVEATITDKKNNTEAIKRNIEENQVKEKEKTEKLSQEDLDNTLKKLNENDDIIKRGLKFEKVDEVDKWVVKVYYVDTGETIRQIPSEEAVQITKGIQEILGTIFDEIV